jgi:hypothetical protein
VDAEIWDPFEENEEDVSECILTRRQFKFEERGLQCIALAGEGKALADLSDTDEGPPSPGELLETVLHAIIG